MARFVVMGNKEAVNCGALPQDELDTSDWRNYLVDTAQNTVIGQDGGEPEDQCLTRDWSWVILAMNALSEGKNP